VLFLATATSRNLQVGTASHTSTLPFVGILSRADPVVQEPCSTRTCQWKRLFFFFEHLGYHCVPERADNRALRARRIESFVAYLEMALQSPES